jgi:hypothetical protein
MKAKMAIINAKMPVMETKMAIMKAKMAIMISKKGAAGIHSGKNGFNRAPVIAPAMGAFRQCLLRKT